jgi:hypothetical protein
MFSVRAVGTQASSLLGNALLLGIVATASLLPLTTQAQMPNLVEIGAQYLPSAELVDPKPAEVQVASYDAAINVPIPLSKSTYLVVGAAYHIDSIDYDNVPDRFIELLSFHSVEVPLLLVQLLPKRWALSIRLAPGLAGDFKAIDGDVFRLTGVALATYAFSDKFVLGGGGLTTFSFGSFLPLPALYVDWWATDWLQVETFVPAFVNLRFVFANRLELGARLDFSGNEYAVRDERIRSSPPCAAQTSDDPSTPQDDTLAQPDQCLDHLAYSVGVAGGFAGVRLLHSLWLTVFAGHSFYRRLDMMNADNELIDGGQQSIPDVFTLRASLSWRIPQD